MDYKNSTQCLKILYCRASRSWQSSNFRYCLLVCDELSVKLNELKVSGDIHEHELARLRHLVWFLKIRCLADDYHVNESLLFNEDDIEDDDQVQVFDVKKSRHTRSAVTRASSISRTAASGTGKMGRGQRTGILTGRMPTVGSRQSGRATTSYRPLTVSLTATQTAFSKSTRPLLKYSNQSILSKIIYRYLYNAQAITNNYPDYRQCLEYLNLVQSTRQKEISRENRQTTGVDLDILISLNDQPNEKRLLGTFWLISFGICYYNLRMNKEAEEYFREALNVNPNYLDSYTWLVKIYLRSNQPVKVLNICEAGLKQSRNPILYNWMARVQSLLNDTYTANLHLQESLKYNPTNIEALANVGHFAFYSDKAEQSLKCFERIKQLSMNQSTSLKGDSVFYESSAQLSNNLALCNFYCGFFYKVMPLFSKSFLNCPNKEVTSDIWYNISFVPLSCGLVNLAIACLRLALKNNSQNEEALNNLGVLRYGSLINDDFHIENRQEAWASSNQKSSFAKSIDFEEPEELNWFQTRYDDAETYFDIGGDQELYERSAKSSINQPEMLYNMAILKKRRGQLLASMQYCNSYLEHDQNNHHIKELLNQIRSLVAHDS